MLYDTGPELCGGDRYTCSRRRSTRRLEHTVVGRSGRRCRTEWSKRLCVLCDNVAIILFASAAQKLEGDDEEDDADAAPSEHPLGGDAP